jgi:hypothetical protein
MHTCPGKDVDDRFVRKLLEERALGDTVVVSPEPDPDDAGNTCFELAAVHAYVADFHVPRR